MKSWAIAMIIALTSILLPNVSFAQADGDLQVDDINPGDLKTSDFGWDDVEDLPLATDEEGGVEIDGQEYQKQSEVADEAAMEMPSEEVDLSTQEPSTAPSPATDVVRLGSGPENYTIAGGDTLWDICNRLFGDPYLWPKLWAMNQYITNPHLIFPGDQLRFFMGTATQAPRLEVAKAGDGVDVVTADLAGVETTEELPGEPVEVASVAPISTEPTKMKEFKSGSMAGAIEIFSRSIMVPDKIKSVGKISHSGEEKSILSTNDRVYLKFNNPETIKKGDRFLIVEKTKKVPHPKRLFKKVGYLVQIKGQVRVVAFNKKVITGVIEDSWQVSQRNDRLIPYKPLVRQVVPKESSKDLQGYIVESSIGNAMIGHRDLAFVDLGKQQGLEPGDKLRVVREGDGVYGQSKDLPDVSVAELTVVEAEDNLALAFVNWTRKTLEVGDRVKTRL